MTEYEEKAKQIIYKSLGWKRFFMSRKRKNRFIRVMANTMKMAECIKDDEYKEFEKKYDKKECTPEDVMDVVTKVLIESCPFARYSTVEENPVVYFNKIGVDK